MSTTHQTYLAGTAADEAVPAPYQGLHRIPVLEHTNSAVAAMDAEDARPMLGRDYAQGHAHGYIDGLRACAQRPSRGVLFVVGVMVGAACALLWTVFA